MLFQTLTCVRIENTYHFYLVSKWTCPRLSLSYHSLYMGLCTRSWICLDAILLLGNMFIVHKNTTRLCYVILGLVKLELDMSYDT